MLLFCIFNITEIAANIYQGLTCEHDTIVGALLVLLH